MIFHRCADFSRDRERVMILIEIKFKFQEEMWNGGKKFVSFSYFNGFFIIVHKKWRESIVSDSSEIYCDFE